MPWQDYIEPDPLVFFGKSIFKGTRITVESVLKLGAAELRQGSLARLDERLKPLGLSAEHFFALVYQNELSDPPGRRA